MQIGRLALAALLLFLIEIHAPAQEHRIVIAASTVLDGRGAVLRDTRIVVEGSKIAAIDLSATDGKPLDAITAVRRAVFVMRGGTVHKHVRLGTGP